MLRIICACSFNSLVVPMTISCSTLPTLCTTKRTVSPRLTAIESGVKRIVSAIDTLIVRDTLAGLPGWPDADSAEAPWLA
ncbi:hypothetical protein [Cupriavidus basilensis]